ncbi:MAG: hypothetical protein HYT79_02005 [Elusimicrobia bacterium]|nr:hypothetical protein [Elusimicrobiota bacterium]
MLDIPLMRRLFAALNKELADKDIVGEIGLCGGAAMCLAFQARRATKDIDAIFAPSGEIRKAARRVAKEFGLPEDWLNDAAKGYFLTDPPRQDVLELSHLRIWAPKADYMLVMKCLAGRADTQDTDDIKFLLKYLNIKASPKVFSLIARYCPHARVPAKTKFLVEEILG